MPAHETTAALAGAHVLVTRPAHQAAGLCEMIAAAGGRASRLPVIEIAGPADPAAVEAILGRMAMYDIAVFVSPNAVEQTLARLAPKGWPGGPRVAVVGQGSAAALARHGVAVDICPPSRFDSEGLLDEAAMRAVGGLRIVILRGDGGRDLLATTLRARGAQVDFAEVYRRAIPAGAAAELRRIAGSEAVDAIVVTSNEGLRNLDRIAGADLGDWLRARQLVVISARAATLAGELGFTRPARVAAEASDAGLLAALRQWRGESAGTDRGRRHVH